MTTFYDPASDSAVGNALTDILLMSILNFWWLWPISTTDFVIIRQIQKIFLRQLILNQIPNFAFAFELWNHPLRQSNSHKLAFQMIRFLFSASSITSSASHFTSKTDKLFDYRVTLFKATRLKCINLIDFRITIFKTTLLYSRTSGTFEQIKTGVFTSWRSASE